MSVTDMRYTRTAVILHWLIGLGLIAMLFFGWWMSDLPKEGPKSAAFDLFNWGLYTVQLAEPVTTRTFYFNLHKSIGFTILLPTGTAPHVKTVGEKARRGHPSSVVHAHGTGTRKRPDHDLV
jgi:hypothetical protein